MKNYKKNEDDRHLSVILNLSIHLEPLFSSLLLYFHKFLFENVGAVYYCVFEGLRILLDHDSVARDAHLHLHVLVLMVWKQ